MVPTKLLLCTFAEINFLAQKRSYFYLQKVQNKNFSVTSKHDIPCYRKHLIAFLRTETSSVSVLKISCKFHKTKKRSFYQLPALKEIFFLLPEIHNITFSSSEKFIIWTFYFVQSSCFCNNFFLIFAETYSMFLLIILKDILNLHYKKKYEAELKNFFLSEIPMSILVTSEIPWNRIWHFSFAENETKTSVF